MEIVIKTQTYTKWSRWQRRAEDDLEIGSDTR